MDMIAFKEKWGKGCEWARDLVAFDYDIFCFIFLFVYFLVFGSFDWAREIYFVVDCCFDEFDCFNC